METSTPVSGNQEGTGRQEPEMRDLPASVSWVVSHEPHLFSLWWRWGGSHVGSPTRGPSCRLAPILTCSASTDISSCFPLPCGKHILPLLGGDFQQELRPLPTFPCTLHPDTDNLCLPYSLSLGYLCVSQAVTLPQLSSQLDFELPMPKTSLQLSQVPVAHPGLV